VSESDRNLQPMFSCSPNLTHQGIDSQEMWLPIFWWISNILSNILPSSMYLQNHFFWENLQLKPMESVSAYFLTTDRPKAIVTKLDQTIKETEIYNGVMVLILRYFTEFGSFLVPLRKWLIAINRFSPEICHKVYIHQPCNQARRARCALRGS